MRVLFNQYYIHTRSGISREYYEGFMEEFDTNILSPLLENNIVQIAPKELQSVCMIKYNSKVKMNNTISINNFITHLKK